MQLSVLAAENAALRAKLTEREQAAQLEMQDLRKFCIASQERDSEKDSAACKELQQQQQQQMMSHLSDVESLANQAHASTQHISTRLDKVCNIAMNDKHLSTTFLWSHQGCPKVALQSLCCHSQQSSNSFEHVVILCMVNSCNPQTLLLGGLCSSHLHLTLLILWYLCQYEQLLQCTCNCYSTAAQPQPKMCPVDSGVYMSTPH